MKTIKELMQWRFACKHFDGGKKIEQSVLMDLLDTTRLAPSSFGIQAWKFVVVTNQELRAKLLPACYGQAQVTEASALVFFCADTKLIGPGESVDRFMEAYHQETGKTAEQTSGYKQMIVGMISGKPAEANLNWVQKQVYIPVQTLILAAAEKEIDSCPMEGFNSAEVAKVLELPENLVPTVLVSLGYRSMEAPKKVRFALADVLDLRA